MIYEVTYKKNGYEVTEKCGVEWLKNLQNNSAVTNLTWKAKI